MTAIQKIAYAALLAASALGASVGAGAQQLKMNWTPPAKKMYAQQLIDAIKAKHPELLSIAFHGVPPGRHDTYTMFAGSFVPTRNGEADDPEDIDVSTKGITIVDPRWHRHDPAPKFVVEEPLRDAAARNVGELVVVFKNPSHGAKAEGKYERHFFLEATSIRDRVERKIPSYAALFAPAK